MAKRPHLSFWQIWNMSFGFLGIQFGFALQNANVSRIFQTLGAEVDEIAFLWIAAPVTGLLVQPIIGHMSDKTWTRLGRRRPYFLIGAIFASLALIVMPNSPVLWVAAGMLWIMDASINISMEPFRAYVGDMLPAEQRTQGFAMQSFFIGTGAVVASALPFIMTKWIGISNVAPEGKIAPSVQWSFYTGAIVFFLAVLWTVIRSREYTPEEMEKFEAYEKKVTDKPEITDTKISRKGGERKFKWGLISAMAGLVITALVYYFNFEKEVYVLSFGLIVFGIIQIAAGSLQKSGKVKNALVEIMDDFTKMPKTMLQLSLVQFFSWFALFSMWIYTTAAVTKHTYGTTDTTSAIYNDGADWVGILFAVYNGVAALVAFGLPAVAKLTNRKITHLLALLLGGLGLISVYFIKDPNMLIISMVGVGIAWASILSMPYAILSGALPAQKMGIYMGIFNFFIVIPQILAATLLGFFTKSLFGGDAIYTLMLGGAAMILAGFLTLMVDDVDYKTAQKKRSH
jgi:maltose/moltooligosaccharide transporter